MREILFRGKAINREPKRAYRTKYKNGDWVYGLLTDTENYLGFTEMTNTDGVCGIEVDKNTIGQYTGLTDKNGKKIFEGDIVKNEYAKGHYQYFKIFFCDRTHAWEVSNKYNFLGHLYHVIGTLEVIGNIHDNPELLKGGE